MSELDNALMKELLETFSLEASDHLETLNRTLLAIERQPDAIEESALLQEAFRAAHSLKGAARAVTLKDIEKVAHALETVLQQARDDDLKLTADVCDVLYDGLDAIQTMLKRQPVKHTAMVNRLRALTGQPPEPEPSEDDTPVAMPDTPDAPSESPGTADTTDTAVATDENIPDSTAASQGPHRDNAYQDESIRVSVRRLDDLMAQVGELLVSRISAEQRVERMRDIRYHTASWSKTWREVQNLLPRLADSNGTGQQLMDVLLRHADTMHVLTQQINDLERDTGRDAVRLNMLVDRLQNSVRGTRMVPFETIVPMLERVVRDAARSEDRPIEFFLSGRETEIDRKVLEMLKDPLIHLLRNAVGHGIESIEERQAAGKPAAGQIVLHVEQRGSEVHLRVKDDGRGFDVTALQTAYRNRHGDLPPEMSGSDDQQIRLAFVPGISTMSHVSELAGRGIGLDVVRQQIESMQGRIQVDNRPGRGVIITLVVPTSLAMTRGLLVRAGDHRYVIPLLAIEKIVEPNPRVVVSGKQMLMLDDIPVPLVVLSSLLCHDDDDVEADRQLALILAVADKRVALVVDDAITEQDVAVKPPGLPLKRVTHVMGAALMGSGEPIIVLNPADLVRHAGQAAAVVTPGTPLVPEDETAIRVLVVDDSITTRTLEKNILQAAGYEVITATDGEEALRRLREQAVDIIVSDIEMPNLDGFDLTRMLRDDSELSDMPIILVTSLESQADREKGLQAGADAYIVKRGFDQAELLATIERFL